MKSTKSKRNQFFRGMGTLALAVFLLYACGPNTPEVAGVIEFVTGEAFISRTTAEKNAEKSIALGDPVRFEDQIRTESDSGVELLMREYGILRIGEKTLFKVSDLSDEKRVEVRVDRGKAGMFLKKKTADRELVITTPTVTAGVRGTEFLITADAAGASKVALFGGAVELKDAGGNRVVLDKPGEVKVKKGQQISNDMIEPLSAESIAEMKALEAIGSMEASKTPAQPAQPRTPAIPGDPGK